jgi:16S rRNA (cytosine1407-C5)-methyltransferase
MTTPSTVFAMLPPEFEFRLKEILPQRPESLFKPSLYQCFRINTLKVSIGEAHELLAHRGIDFQKVGFCPYAVLVDKKGDKFKVSPFLDLVNDGLLYAQGLESLLPVMVLDPRPGERVLDLCAAPGSKTSQIAMHMQNTGFLKANEPIRQRLYKLKAVLQLSGAQAQISSVDGRRLKEHGELFDCILVDAPCSSEGRFRMDEPKSFAYWSLRKIKEMSHKQKGLLMNAGRLIKPSGVLVYATCTFAPEENEEVVDFVLRKTEGRFELVPIKMDGVKTYPGLNHWQKRTYNPRISQAMRILPDERMEGFFIAKFVNCNYK